MCTGLSNAFNMVMVCGDKEYCLSAVMSIRLGNRAANQITAMMTAIMPSVVNNCSPRLCLNSAVISVRSMATDQPVSINPAIKRMLDTTLELTESEFAKADAISKPMPAISMSPERNEVSMLSTPLQIAAVNGESNRTHTKEKYDGFATQ